MPPAIIIKPIRVQLSQLTQLPLQRRRISTVIDRRYRKSARPPQLTPKVFASRQRRLQTRRLGVVDAAVIDGELSLFQLAVDIDKAFAEADVMPCIILLSLHSGGNDGFHAHD